MTSLRIVHTTRYDYRRPVVLGPHRLMLLPRESRSLQVASFELQIQPDATIAWTHDVLGNSVATVSFAAPSTSLSIESRVELRHSEAAWPVFPISASAITYPFSYSPDEQSDLGALRTPRFDDPRGRFAAWAEAFKAPGATDTLSLLKDLNAGMTGWIAYEVREEYGTQVPLDSLDRGRGSCRDIATLMVEAARHFGFGARTVSGYLWDPDACALGSAGAGSTHAWVEIYVPGAGWITFDPTNRAVGAGHLVPVAVARAIEQIPPVSGGYQGAAEDFRDMSVSVEVASR